MGMARRTYSSICRLYMSRLYAVKYTRKLRIDTTTTTSLPLPLLPPPPPPPPPYYDTTIAKVMHSDVKPRPVKSQITTIYINVI